MSKTSIRMRNDRPDNPPANTNSYATYGRLLGCSKYHLNTHTRSFSKELLNSLGYNDLKKDQSLLNEMLDKSVHPKNTTNLGEFSEELEATLITTSNNEVPVYIQRQNIGDYEDDVIELFFLAGEPLAEHSTETEMDDYPEDGMRMSNWSLNDQQIKTIVSDLMMQFEYVETFRSMVADLIVVLNPEGVLVDCKPVDSPYLYKPTGQFIGLNYHQVLPESVVKKLESAIANLKGDLLGLPFFYDLDIDGEMMIFEARLKRMPSNQLMVLIKHHAGNVMEFDLQQAAAVLNKFTDEETSTQFFTYSNHGSEFNESHQVRPIYDPAKFSQLVRVQEQLLLLSVVASTTNSGVVITDAHQRIIWVNESFEKLSGYHLVEIIGKRPSFFQGQETAQKDRDIVREGVDRGTPFRHEILNYNKNGSSYWIELNITPVRNHLSEITHYVGIELDITERKRAEQELAKTKDLLDQAGKMATLGAYELDYTTGSLYWSDVTRLIHEVPDDFVPTLENAISFYKNEKAREQIRAAVENARLENTHFDLELEITTFTQKSKWVRTIGKTVISEDQKVIRLFGVFQDITADKNRQEWQLQFIREAPTAIAMFDTNIFYLEASRKWLEDYRLTNQQIIGRNHYEIFPSIPERWKQIHQAALKGRTFSMDVDCLDRSNGLKQWLKWTVKPWFTEDGNIGGIIIQTEDITEIIEAQKRAQKLFDITIKQNEQLRQFAYIISHNLRTHAGNMGTLLELLKFRQPGLVKEELFGLTTTAVNNLKETIANLGEVVKATIDNDQPLELISLFASACKAISSVNTLAKSSKVNVINALKGDEMVAAVPAYLDSILLNFLTNAVKYSNPKAYEASFVKVSSYKEGVYRVICFEDNGLGIDLTLHGANIFGLYKTFHPHSDSKGIGLYITRSQVESMGGRIEVTSEPMKGTTFRVFLLLTK